MSPDVFAPSAGPRAQDGRVLVGRIRRPHGIKGEVRVELHTDNPDRFVAGAAFYLVPAKGRELRVVAETVRAERDTLLVRFAGQHDRNAVESWRDARLEVDDAELPALEAGELYQFELVGLEAIDRHLGRLGVVESAEEDGGGVLLEIRTARGLLPVPYVAAYGCEKKGGTLELELPDGFVEAFVRTTEGAP